MIDAELLKILVCPDCRGDLAEEKDHLVCQSCQKRYPIRDGIPILLADEAQNPKG